MTAGWTESSSHGIIEWPPPLDDRSVLEALTAGVVLRVQTEVSEVVTRLRPELSVRARATVGVALLLREHQDAPLRALFATAQDLLGPETDETCESVVGLLSAGWSQGVGELLAASRVL